ncbi:hypothetical protein HHK36_002010 [Tetracentron sinense]|uniref:Uncharacterized protein n=1 Tax=Tetracentron sinense TaxID=13715 RepID=A0A834ZXA8_TETSI|nr:hypothetical protein HHK36_002010 [Tetracentron sinense]
MVRTPCCEKTGIKKGAWTPEEDKKLSAYIRRYGHWNWRELPKYAASEAKLNSNETSQCEASKKRELEPNTSLHDAHTHQIIESSSLSSQPSSSEFSSSTDSAAVNATNSVAEDTVISPETFVEPSGNFWTEPYFAGNSYIQEDFPVTFVDPGSMFPFSTVSLGEYFCSYGSDGMDWFN